MRDALLSSGRESQINHQLNYTYNSCKVPDSHSGSFSVIRAEKNELTLRQYRNNYSNNNQKSKNLIHQAKMKSNPGI